MVAQSSEFSVQYSKFLSSAFEEESEDAMGIPEFRYHKTAKKPSYAQAASACQQLMQELSELT